MTLLLVNIVGKQLFDTMVTSTRVCIRLSDLTDRVEKKSDTVTHF